MCLSFFFCLFDLHFNEQVLLAFPVLVHCLRLPTLPRFFASYDTLAVFAGCISSITTSGACLLCFVCAFFSFVDCFSCRFCLRHFLVSLTCHLRRPCGCAFCCFCGLICFAVGVMCESDFVACFVCARACLVPCCLCVSRANLLVFVVVVASVCLLRAHAHTLVSTRALAHALTLAHNIVCYTWFYYLLSPSASLHDQPQP